ncbi:MAG: AAA family ATPase [Desulfobacterales bacterium]|nr:AAA family ATPase [Desulfobacterales bacterium]
MTQDSRPSMAEFFGYRHHPFADTRHGAHAFIGPKDERICNRALSLLQCGKSFALCGPSGAGKSTLTAYLAGMLDPTIYKPVMLHYAGFNRSGLLRAIADRLGVDTAGRGVPLLVRLQKHLLQLTGAANSLYPVLFIDDAQLLERESMMDLCSLMVSAEKKTVAASIVLIGDDTLRQLLKLSVLAPVRTRLTAIFPMDPLDDKNSEQFITHRLDQAKAPKHLFEADVMALISAHCRGNRRLIMNTATLLLDEAYFRQEKTVNAQTMLECDLIQPEDGN